MKACEFDKHLDAGEDVARHLDVANARRPEQEQKRVNADFSVCALTAREGPCIVRA